MKFLMPANYAEPQINQNGFFLRVLRSLRLNRFQKAWPQHEEPPDDFARSWTAVARQQPRHRFRTGEDHPGWRNSRSLESGVALRFPPQSKTLLAI
jgi:hypothetical protein